MVALEDVRDLRTSRSLVVAVQLAVDDIAQTADNDPQSHVFLARIVLTIVLVRPLARVHVECASTRGWKTAARAAKRLVLILEAIVFPFHCLVDILPFNKPPAHGRAGDARMQDREADAEAGKPKAAELQAVPCRLTTDLCAGSIDQFDH